MAVSSTPTPEYMVGAPIPPSGGGFPSPSVELPPASSPSGSRGGGAAGVLIGVAVAVLAVAIGVGAFLLLSRNDSGGDQDTKLRGDGAPVETGDDSTSTQPELNSSTAGQAEAVTTTVPAPVSVAPPPSPSLGTKTIWAGTAKLRQQPSLSAAGSDIPGAKGTTVEILSPLQQGWYQVRVHGSEGWMYGGLLSPPDEGYCVADIGADGNAYGATKLLFYENSATENYEGMTAILPDGSTSVEYIVGREMTC